MKRDKHDDGVRDNKVTELSDQVEEYKNKYLRALADYQNLEKRGVSDREEGVKRGVAKFVLELLGVLDLLQKANQHLSDQGLELAILEFEGVLKRQGVTRIEALGKKFDPVEMECVEVSQSDQEDEVLSEMRPGYKMGETVIRPAQVKVGKKLVNLQEEELAKDQLQKGDYM